MKWRYTLSQSAIESLLVRDEVEIRLLVVAFEMICDEPFAPDDGMTTDTDGRPLRVRRIGRTIIGFWPERATGEVKIQVLLPVES